MPSTEKKEKVKKIKKWFDKTDSLLVLHYKGLKVSEATDLRTQVKGLNAELRVVKNTLTRLALADTSKEELVSLLDGPVAVVFVDDDPVPVARIIRDFARGRSEFYLLGGMMEGRILDGGQIEAVAALPPREVLLAKMAGAMRAPLSVMLSLVAAPLRKTLGLFKALADAAPEQEAPPQEQAEEEQPTPSQEKPDEEQEAAPEDEPVGTAQAEADSDESNAGIGAGETPPADSPEDNQAD